MPSSTADFAALADAGWPALERIEVGSWAARFAHGVTQRANSVYPRSSAGIPIGTEWDATIKVVENLYRQRGLPPRFQLADEDAALRTALESRGYEADSETLVLAADSAVVANALARSTAAGVGTCRERESVAIVDDPDDEWLDLWWSVDGRGGAAERAVARRILTGGHALYATTRDARGAASVGRLAIVEQGGRIWGGLYALATRPDARGHGHARAAISALVAAGAERGVGGLWLQVLASNVVGRRLYDGLGFERVATYRYLAARHA